MSVRIGQNTARSPVFGPAATRDRSRSNISATRPSRSAREKPGSAQSFFGLQLRSQKIPRPIEARTTLQVDWGNVGGSGFPAPIDDGHCKAEPAEEAKRHCRRFGNWDEETI